MNILIINHYAGSPSLGMEFRPYYLAKEWIKLGHKVFIIASDFSHLRSKQPIVDSDLHSENTDGITYVWLKTVKYTSSDFMRIMNILMFTTKLLIYYKKIAALARPEIVIASSTYPLDIYPAYYIAKRNIAKLIFEVHDLWPLSPKELGGYSKFHPFISIMQLAENYAYKHCDKVVSILPHAKEHMMEHGLKEDKFCHVPNGIVKEDWENPKELPKGHQILIEGLKNEGKFLVGFAGAHGIANSLYSVIDAAAKLVNQNIVLILIGKGQEKNKLISYVEKSNFKNIIFLNPIDKSSIPTFLYQMDALFIGLRKEPLFRFGISPNKIFDYMMAAKPIIQAIEAGNNLIKEANCGLYVEAENSDEIAGAITKLQSMSLAERKILGTNGYKFVNQFHTYKILAELLLELAQKNLSIEQSS
jgi:glycosyltransferase involved in cell wall biosynthesis